MASVAIELGCKCDGQSVEGVYGVWWMAHKLLQGWPFERNRERFTQDIIISRV